MTKFGTGAYSKKGSFLKGYLAKNNVFKLDNRICLSLKDFNVYDQHEMFVRFVHKQNEESIDVNRFGRWLKNNDFIDCGFHSMKDLNIVNNYRTYPICPKYRHIEDAHEYVISKIKLKEKDVYMNLTNEDILVLAIYLSSQSNGKVPEEKLELSIPSLIDEIRPYVRTIEDHWLIGKGELR